MRVAWKAGVQPAIGNMHVTFVERAAYRHRGESSGAVDSLGTVSTLSLFSIFVSEMSAVCDSAL